MIYRKLRDIYCVDTISQDKGWKKINEELSNCDDDIEIDFTGIKVIEPWKCPEFRILLKKRNIHMKFVNNEVVANKIKMICVIDGLDESRITSKTVEIPKPKTPEEKKVEQCGMALIPLFSITDSNCAIFNARDKYSQMQNTITTKYIKYAISELHKVQGINEFIIELNKITVLSNVVQSIVTMINSFEEDGIRVKIDTDDKEIQKNFKLFMHIAKNTSYSSLDKGEILVTKLKPGTVGMLIKYKKSKALDEFGRHGNGEVVSSRIATFDGLATPDEDKNCACFTSYNNNYFYTKQHWMVEHDNEEPTSLHADRLQIDLNELGFDNVFLGSQYHFIMPVQRSSGESVWVITGLNESGSNIKVKCTIPERIKIVLDDWGIKYAKDALEKAIKETEKLLNEL